MSRCKRVWKRASENRGKNTKKSYVPRVNEFISWCHTKPYAAGIVETETRDKLINFLHEQVLYRDSRRKGSGGRIGASTVRQYVADITDLYQEQVRLRVNSHPHLRNSTVKSLLQSLDKEKHKHKRETFSDSGIDTLQDGYCTTEELASICDRFMNQNTGLALRNRLCLLQCNFMDLRGESQRRLEFVLCGFRK